MWPLEINLGVPTEKTVRLQPEELRAWISSWKSWQGPDKRSAVSLVWSERRYRSLGLQNVPLKLVLECPNDVALWIGEEARWSRAVGRFASLVQRWPEMINTLPRYYSVLADDESPDFLNLTKMLSWIFANPDSNLYIRQIPVPGIHSKWLETRKNIICELAAAVQGDKSGNRDFYSRCGLKPLPQLIRMRILDPLLRSRFGGLGDISAPLEEAAGLDINPINVFIVENIQTALAFNDLKGSVVIMGLGYGVDLLGKIPWLASSRCIYWGDIDTHGFAILKRARSYLPGLEAVLMDKATLLSHRELWVVEKDQHSSTGISLLTGDELMLFQSLKNNIWGQHIRLEQERICWDAAWKVIAGIMNKADSPN